MVPVPCGGPGYTVKLYHPCTIACVREQSVRSASPMEALIPDTIRLRFEAASVFLGSHCPSKGSVPYPPTCDAARPSRRFQRAGRTAIASTSSSAPSRASFDISSVVLAGGAATLTNLSRTSR
jgi:hypothetical protein